MTKKRFTETLSTGIVTDNVTGKEYQCEMRIDDDLLELLNELHEENTRLQNEIQDFQNLLTEREETFLKPIYTALDDAILNERTALGKSVLKQLMETIQ